MLNLSEIQQRKPQVLNRVKAVWFIVHFGTQHSMPFLGHLQSGPHLQSAPAQPLHTQGQQFPVHLSPHWQSGPHLQSAVM